MFYKTLFYKLFEVFRLNFIFTKTKSAIQQSLTTLPKLAKTCLTKTNVHIYSKNFLTDWYLSIHKLLKQYSIHLY